MTVGKIIKAGIGTLGLAGIIWTLNQGINLVKEKDEIPNLNAVVRYYELEKELSKPIKAKELLEQSVMDNYSKIKIQQDSVVNSADNFYDSKQKYDSISEWEKTGSAIYIGFAIITSIFSGLTIADFLNYSRNRKSKKQ